MGAVAFDTLEFFETLKEAGVPDKQAKAFSMVIQKSHEDADLATKQDITQLRYEMSDVRKDMEIGHESLRNEINGLRKDMEVKHESLRKDMKVGHESLRNEINGLRKDMKGEHESLRKDMKVEHESLRKDMEVKHESLQKRIKESELRLIIKLGTIVVATASILPLLPKLLHLF